MFCRKCGKEIPDVSDFCLHCGTKVIIDDSSSNYDSAPEKTSPENNSENENIKYHGYNSEPTTVDAWKNRNKSKEFHGMAVIGIILLVAISLFIVAILINSSKNTATNTTHQQSVSTNTKQQNVSTKNAPNNGNKTSNKYDFNTQTFSSRSSSLTMYTAGELKTRPINPDKSVVSDSFYKAYLSETFFTGSNILEI